MSEIVLNAEPRVTAARAAKRMRNQGLVPGIYYARGEENVSIAVPAPNLDPLIHTTETHIIDLKLKDGTSRRCILRDVQYDPVSDLPVHFDLQGLKENEKLVIEVPIVLTGGTPAGVKDGGMIQHMIRTLKVSCFPKDIPGKIEVNIEGLAINDAVHVKDLNVPNVTILENLESAVVGIMPPTLVKEEEAAAPAEEALAEPEVVGKGKKAEEGEEGAEAPAKGEAKATAAPKEEKKEKK
jgi:large subunit ribosomal protein L25